MRCENCGIEMKQNARFCHLCGTPVQSAVAVAPVKVCKTCGSEMTVEAVYCDNCGVREVPETKVIPRYEEPGDAKEREPLGMSVLIIVGHTLLSILGIVEHMVEGQYVANHVQGISEGILAGVATILMVPHWILLVLGAIFSFVGWVARKSWGYLVSAILQSVSVLFLLGVFVSRPDYLLTYAVVIVLGFVSMSLLKRKGY